MHRYTDLEVDEVLQNARVRQAPWRSATGRFSIFVCALGLCLGAGTGYQSWLTSCAAPAADWPNGTAVATVLLAVVAATFTFYQWADARREASLEKYFERLRLTNERYDDWEAARRLVGHFWDLSEGQAGFERRMYVFLELDNLEYMIIRYELGFVRERLMRRAIRAFAARCESPAFRHLARRLVAGSGYEERTDLVTRVLSTRADTRRYAAMLDEFRAG